MLAICMGIIMKSIWCMNVEIERREPLIGSLKADAAVIGAGMSGILIAWFLKKCGINVVVLEADRIAGGQTKNTTAKITSQHGLFYHKLVNGLGEERARLYAQANETAINEYQKIIEEETICCHFERLPAYLYSTQERYCLEEEAGAASSLGIYAHFDTECELPFDVKGAVCFARQAQFHPLEFISGISKNLTIYEKTRVLSVKGHRIYTERGDVSAENIIFATHFPIINVPGLYFMRQHQERSYVLAATNAQRLNGMYYGIDGNGLSFRNAGDMMLIGGSGHRTGENEIGGAYEYLRIKANQYYRGYEEIACWSAQDCMPHDSIPFIGSYSHIRPYWYVATGFKKWGMTSSMIAAGIIRDEIMGVENPYQELFSPQRFHYKLSHKNLIKDIGISVKGLANGHFRKKAVKCPHMGCELKWNKDEQCFECPCHGSRFDQNGKLLDDPAQTALQNHSIE